MLRAIALYTRYGRLLARPPANVPPAPINGLPKLGKGAQPEWLGKKVLAAAGVRVPAGDLARTADEAVAVARRIGYPVVLKGQAAALSHKTEAGGVIVNLANESAVRAAWDTLVGNVKRAAPKAASSRVARYSFIARLALAARSLFHSPPGIERCLIGTA
jgi:acyl-CoA synthetase (NDP forming)